MKRATPFLPRYRLDFKLRALATLDANDGRIHQTARQLQLPYSTLKDWNHNRERIHREVERLRERRGITLEEQFEAVIAEITNTMLDKVEKARLLESIRVLRMILDLNAELAAKRESTESKREQLREKLERMFARYDGTDESGEQLPNP